MSVACSIVRKFRKAAGCAAFLLVLACPALLQAQFDTAAIVGRVTDPAGAPVHNAVVTLRNVDQGTVQTKKTSDQGDYSFPDIQIGSYVISVAAEGFGTTTTEPINVTVASRPRMDVKMTVGKVSEVVTVSSSATQLETDTSDRGMIVEQREIENLPLNGREYADLATLTPGVQVSSLQDGTITERRGSFNVNGNRSTVNNYLLDGLDNNSYQPANQGFNNQAVTESVDAVSQYKVQTGNYSAEFGRSGGGIFNVTTKSGTNQIHGAVWDYFRNTALNAMGPFYGSGVKPTLVQNQFGVAIGGPIRKDSIFFFADYEGLRQTSTAYETATIPSMDQRAGNFHAHIVDPVTGVPGPELPVGLRNPYITTITHPDGQIPVSDVTPFAAAVLALLPAPTNNNVGGNFVSLPQSQNSRDIGDVRLDIHPSARVQNFFRYTQQSNHITQGPNIPGPVGGDGNGFTRILATQAVGGVTFVVTPNQVLDARFAATWNESGKVPYNHNQPSLNAMYTTYGLPFNPYLSASLNTQDMRNMSYLGTQTTDPQYSNPYTKNFKINDTMVKSKHSISFGYEFFALSEDEDPGTSKLGSDNYTGNFTAKAVGGANPTAGSSTGRNEAYGVADFMYGARDSYSLSNFDAKTMHVRYHYAYVQDTWRATSRLTLNLGMRYEFQIPQQTDGNKQANFDPATNTLQLARDGSIYSRSLVNPQTDNFAPRFGFAFTSDPRTVWRGAYGLSYIQFNRYSSHGNLNLNGPATISSAIEQPTGANVTTPAALCSSATTTYDPSCFRPTQFGYPISIITPAFYSTSTSLVRYIPKDSPTAYMQTYFLGVQMQLAKSTILDIAYVGSHGVKLRVLADWNQAALNPSASSLTNLDQRRPIPGFIGIYGNLSAGFSRYNSLQVRLQTHTKQIFLVNSFTWSRAIDNALADGEEHYGDSSYVNLANIKGDSGTSGYNQPLNETLALIWNLPFGNKRTHGLYNELVGGWQVNTITKLTSGVPINFTWDPSASLATTGLPYNYRPDLTGSPYTVMHPRNSWVKTDSSVNNVFNFGQLSHPASPNVYGNAPRNFLRGTPYYNVDLGLHKIFPVTKRDKVEFRAEAFNALNHTNWRAADSDMDSSTPGQLAPSDAYPSRKLQFAIKILF